MSKHHTVRYVIIGAASLFVAAGIVWYAESGDSEPPPPQIQSLDDPFITPTISVENGRLVATCPNPYALRYENLAGDGGGVICMKVNLPPV